MAFVLFFGVIYMILGVMVFMYCEMNFDVFHDEKRELIESAYLWGLVGYYIFLLLLVFGD